MGLKLSKIPRRHMTLGEDRHRVKATELQNMAARENDPKRKIELETLALSYLRLATQARRNSGMEAVLPASAIDQKID